MLSSLVAFATLAAHALAAAAGGGNIGVPAVQSDTAIGIDPTRSTWQQAALIKNPVTECIEYYYPPVAALVQSRWIFRLPRTYLCHTGQDLPAHLEDREPERDVGPFAFRDALVPPAANSCR